MPTFSHTERYARLKAEGLCTVCTKPRGEDGTGTKCLTCADKHRAYSQQAKATHRALGHCVSCFAPKVKTGRTRCEKCLSRGSENAMTVRASYIQKGRCAYCGSAPMDTLEGREPVCLTCFFKRAARETMGNRKFWPVLKAQWDKQGGVCPYTGLLLQLRITASIDHVLPSSRFPERESDATNIQWVHYRVNEMKKDWTPNEFLSFMRSIMDYTTNTPPLGANVGQ